MNRSGFHDRRGFEWVIRVNLALIPVGLGVLIFHDWKIGLVIALSACCSFIVVEAASAPPPNSPKAFASWSRRQPGRRPVLLCLGDSLTHGSASGNFTTELPFKLSETLGLAPPKRDLTFADPLWVVNAGQNGLTTHTILHERLSKALGCYPDFIMIMIGTNDLRSVYSSRWGKQAKRINGLPEVPTMETFERNLKGILDFCYQASPLSVVGVCSLPPMGENLDHAANRLVRQANEVIERLVSKASGKVSLLPVYAQLESILEKKGRRSMSLPVDYFFPLGLLMNPLFHLLFFIFDWNRLSALVGNVVLSDGLHLNERGRDEVVTVVVDWLVRSNISKAIAVKSFG
jgi:lysophospholipase L1-like esterase